MYQNTFFTKDVHENEIGLDVNEDVLERIYSHGILPTDKRPIEFFYVSDTEEKVRNLKDSFTKTFPDYTGFKIQNYKDGYELLGTTEPIEMSLNAINKWNQAMWDIGYAHDCRLDGWQVES